MHLNSDVCNLISSYIHKKKKYELLDWIDIQKLDMNLLSRNPNAIDYDYDIDIVVAVVVLVIVVVFAVLVLFVVVVAVVV